MPSITYHHRGDRQDRMLSFTWDQVEEDRRFHNPNRSLFIIEQLKDHKSFVDDLVISVLQFDLVDDQPARRTILWVDETCTSGEISLDA